MVIRLQQLQEVLNISRRSAGEGARFIRTEFNRARGSAADQHFSRLCCLVQSANRSIEKPTASSVVGAVRGRKHHPDQFCNQQVDEIRSSERGGTALCTSETT